MGHARAAQVRRPRRPRLIAADRPPGRSQQVDPADGPAPDRRSQGRGDRAGARAAPAQQGNAGSARPRVALGAPPGRRAGRRDRLEDARPSRSLRAALDGETDVRSAEGFCRIRRRDWPGAPPSSRTSRSAASSRARLGGCPRAMRCRSCGPCCRMARMPATSTFRYWSGGRSRPRWGPTPRPCWRCSRTNRSGACRSCAAP